MEENSQHKVHGNFRHGESHGTVEYTTWMSIIQRCSNPHRPEYPRYGGRGITVAEEWKDYPTFLSDMGRRPSKEYSIERIDNDLGYTPGNTVWATRKEQNRNRSNARLVEAYGVTRTLAEWVEVTGLGRMKIRGHLRKGLPLETLLSNASWNPGASTGNGGLNALLG